MDKVQLLNDTYHRFMEIGLAQKPPTNLSEFAVEDVMGFGTTIDEKLFSIEELRGLLYRQIEQSQGMRVNYKITPVLRRVFADGNAAIYSDEIMLTLTINNQIIELHLRFSVVFEFIKDRWMVIHWHGSKPENVQTDKDTFGIEEWKERNAALEKIVAERTSELTKQKEELQRTLQELRNAQAQLIHSEKMASLGELTAGVAHEIQNPLNFVNNFSEINTELIEEIQHEIDKGNNKDAKAILNDLKDNEQKINFHGKRADSIVKGMLQHSRSSSGIKEPGDINALTDEYLRLAYHGLRAKDKSFNATLKTNYDDSIGSIDIVPQDIGRVILNLITNAFYAVTEKLVTARAAGDNTYEPTVTVSTKKLHNCIEIKISDNGNGIPAKIANKIFQPFFTTKPTGQGTGLGLSMSYDIITKGHNGELKTESVENEGATFIIILPI